MTHLRLWSALSVAFALCFGCSGNSAAPPRAAGNSPIAVSMPPDLPRLAENNAATFKLYSDKGHGTGFAVSHDGYIVTAFHVVKNKTRYLTCRTMTGESKTQVARVIAHDSDLDVAVVKADCWIDHPVIFARRDDVRNGEPVYNIGYPYDFNRVLGRGFVMQRNFDFPPYDIVGGIAVDMPDGHGTSGSAVFMDRDGRAIGFMDMLVPRPSFEVPLTVIRILRSSDDVMDFLENNHVPYIHVK